ncbi:MliC family protein [Gilvimarinus xylanilyticus]|uniref:MliC family protein n=1 Tax=Gilvimarinus xylanilyticus TaxID=2944139 RepID=A0A9X2HWB0_9GAMM|nr:MliC family protein [Gilvimarinus xylanilyticus]MCP8899583.1 MliC family protein [Gilvimarinus xylanilyticus]
MMSKLWLLGAFLGLLCACSPDSNKTEVDDSAVTQGKTTTESYGPDSWKAIIPDTCASFFDGCNTCTRAPGAATAACTRKACMQYKEPRCLDQDAAKADAEFSQINYQCADGETFIIFRGEYRASDMRVKLEENEIWLSNTQTRTAHRMKRVSSASGEKYSDGEITFWSKGDEALVQEGEKILYRGCQVKS